MVKVNPARVIIWQKPQSMGIQPLGTSPGSILKLLLFSSFFNRFRKIPFASLFIMWYLFYFIHVYIAQGQGETTRGDIFLMEAEMSYHFDHWLHVSKKKSLPSDFMQIFFLVSYMYTARYGQTTHWGWNFDVNRKASSLWSFVASMKKISSTSDFIHIFSWFTKCI